MVQCRAVTDEDVKIIMFDYPRDGAYVVNTDRYFNDPSPPSSPPTEPLIDHAAHRQHVHEQQQHILQPVLHVYQDDGTPLPPPPERIAQLGEVQAAIMAGLQADIHAGRIP